MQRFRHSRKPWISEIQTERREQSSQPKKRAKRFEKSVLFLEHAPCQEGDEIDTALAVLNCEPVYIPPEHTGLLQMNDVGLMKPFKVSLATCWEDRIIEQLCSTAADIHLSPPNRYDVVRDVVVSLADLEARLNRTYSLSRTYTLCLGDWMKEKLCRYHKIENFPEKEKVLKPTVAHKFLEQKTQFVEGNRHSVRGAFATTLPLPEKKVVIVDDPQEGTLAASLLSLAEGKPSSKTVPVKEARSSSDESVSSDSDSSDASSDSSDSSDSDSSDEDKEPAAKKSYVSFDQMLSKVELQLVAEAIRAELAKKA